MFDELGNRRKSVSFELINKGGSPFGGPTPDGVERVRARARRRVVTTQRRRFARSNRSPANGIHDKMHRFAAPLGGEHVLAGLRYALAHEKVALVDERSIGDFAHDHAVKPRLRGEIGSMIETVRRRRIRYAAAAAVALGDVNVTRRRRRRRNRARIGDVRRGDGRRSFQSDPFEEFAKSSCLGEGEEGGDGDYYIVYSVRVAPAGTCFALMLFDRGRRCGSSTDRLLLFGIECDDDDDAICCGGRRSDATRLDVRSRPERQRGDGANFRGRGGREVLLAWIGRVAQICETR